MPGWSHEREPARLDRCDRASRREHRRFERGRAGDGVAVEPRLAVERGERFDVPAVVDALDLLPACRLAVAGASERLEQHREPLSALGVVVPGQGM